jgi:hypothetical protein
VVGELVVVVVLKGGLVECGWELETVKGTWPRRKNRRSRMMITAALAREAPMMLVWVCVRAMAGGVFGWEGVDVGWWGLLCVWVENLRGERDGDVGL